MINLILTIIRFLVQAWVDYRNPDKRKELLEIAKAKAGDQALFKANDMIGIAKKIKKVNDELSTAVSRKLTAKDIRALLRRRQHLWEKFMLYDEQYRRLLIKE